MHRESLACMQVAYIGMVKNDRKLEPAHFHFDLEVETCLLGLTALLFSLFCYLLETARMGHVFIYCKPSVSYHLKMIILALFKQLSTKYTLDTAKFTSSSMNEPSCYEQ